MKPKCVEAVQAAAAALGRKNPLTAKELQAIDDRIQSTMRYLARTDKTWQSKSTDQRVIEAGTVIAKELKEEAERKLRNAQLQIVATARLRQRLEGDKEHGDSRSKALVHDMDNTSDYIQAVKHEATAHLMDLMTATKSGKDASFGRRVAMFLFDVDNPAMRVDLAREIYAKADGSSGNAIAKAGARAWLDTIEALRTRFNAGGGDVGKLGYGYLPTPHDGGRIRAAGRMGWIAKVMPMLDRDRYVDHAGTRLTDAEMHEVLSKSWTAIATEGLSDKMLGIEIRPGARADRGMEHRELHFKGADGYLAYVNAYGTGSMYDAMLGHVGRMARDIGLVERYGPNPNAQFRLQFDTAAQHDAVPVEGLKRVFGLKPQSYWNYLNGTTTSAESASLAAIGSAVRALQTAGKLGSAVIASVTDVATYFQTVHYNKLPYWQSIANIGKTVGSKDARGFLTAHGIIAESMAADLNRWTGDNIKATWAGRMANSTLRLSLMNAWTDSLRRAFSLTMMQGLARLAGKDWSVLGEWDRTHLERKGITAEDWSVIQRAELTHFQGVDHLTPESIHATGDLRSNEIVAKVLGLIQDESEYAVLNPDLATKIVASGGLQRGTGWGELARSVMQFKSFPIAMVSRHWRRMLDMPLVTDGSAPVGLGGPKAVNRLLYGGALLVSTTALGAIACQAKQIVSGKDPVDMTGPHGWKFWGKALAQGGGLSIVGDMLLNDPGNSPSDYVKSTLGTLAGPSLSTAAQALAIPVVNAWDSAKGKPTHTAAQEVQLIRGNVPYVNIWYAKAALDHAGMHALQENLSPGYLGRMQQQAQKDWGQGYWWKPGTGGPQRAPDIGKAVGQ